MIQGKARTQTTGTNEKYVGFINGRIVAVNPTRQELNKLLGKEDGEDDKVIDYVGTDKEGNTRVRIVFWLYDTKLDKYFAHSFNITDKPSINKAGDKKQYINSVSLSTWADSEANLPDFFTKFTDKEKNEIGTKTYHEALMGEADLAVVIRNWLGRFDFNDPEGGITLNTKALLQGDMSELKAQIDGDFDTPFVQLLGVRTDEADSEKQYQQVYGKSFLPNGFLEYIKKGKFPTEYTKKAWKRFEDEVNGEYGFSSYFELVPAKVYDADEDPAKTPALNEAAANPKSSKY